MWYAKESDEAQAHSQVQVPGHQAKFSHELIAAAASYEAAKSYEDHVRAHGKPVNHQKALELLAGFSGGFIDRLFETKGLDALDRERAKHDAHKRAEAALGQYGGY